MSRLPACLAALLILATPSTLTAQETTSAPASSEPTHPAISEVQAFMADYAADLAAQDREAIADRYHPDGAYMIFDGEGGLESLAAIRGQYLKSWRGPEAFAWRDLVYEPVGPDAMLVNGRFEWTAGGRVAPISYTALLKRRAGGWRIRMENETQIRQPSG